MRNPDDIQFRELVDSARSFCRLIDQASADDDWLVELFQLLPRLHAAVVAMHDPGGELPPQQADLDDRFDLFSELRARLGALDMYWLEYDEPDDVISGEEHRTGSLADDLTDIYFELRRGLELLDATSPEAVAHLWETGYHQHWGQHLVDAERHLYTLKVHNQLQH